MSATKKSLPKFISKKNEFWDGVFIGVWYTFDFDIEIYTDQSGHIQDYSGCGYEKAKELINFKLGLKINK